MMGIRNWIKYRADEARKNGPRKVRKPSKKDVDRTMVENNRMPPVMVRSSYDTRSMSRKRSKKAKLKRRYDISLSKAGTRGVEMRLPSLPVVHPGWRVISLLILIGSVLVLNYLLTSPTFKVTSITVEGLLRLTDDDIARTLGLMNKSVFALNPERMEEALVQVYPEITNVSILVTFPAKVLIRLNERVPMIAWVMDEETLWIDGNGFIFPPRGEADMMVPVFADVSPPVTAVVRLADGEDADIEGERQSFMSEKYINAIFKLKPQAPENSSLLYDGTRGFGWADPRGWNVFFGSEIDDIDSKLHVYYAIVENLEGEGITPGLISVAYLHAPYYR